MIRLTLLLSVFVSLSPAFVGVGRADGRQAGEYTAILDRIARLQARRSDTFWFPDTPGVVKSTSWGNRIERICTWVCFEARDGRSPSDHFPVTARIRFR